MTLHFVISIPFQEHIIIVQEILKQLLEKILWLFLIQISLSEAIAGNLVWSAKMFPIFTW